MWTVAEVAKTFGSLWIAAESLGDFRYGQSFSWMKYEADCPWIGGRRCVTGDGMFDAPSSRSDSGAPAMPPHRPSVVTRHLLIAAAVAVPAAGCHDGPLYALKQGNPFFTMRRWAADEAIGPSDHVRRQELIALAESIETMPPDKQRSWTPHLREIIANDQSAEMRRLATLAAGKSSDPAALPLIETTLDDANVKVRLESCRALGRRREPQAAQLLAKTIGSTGDLDVRQAAIAEIANHPGPVANDALQLALEHRNPATRDLVLTSLRTTTGQDYGTDPQAWIAALSPPASEGGTVRR